MVITPPSEEDNFIFIWAVEAIASNLFRESRSESNLALKPIVRIEGLKQEGGELLINDFRKI